MGLLDIAWVAAPGDRQLRRDRRRHQLGIVLDPQTGEPWELIHDPATGELRPEAEVERRRRWTITLADAAVAGEARHRDRVRTVAAAVQAIEASDPAGVVPLMVLREGHVPPPSSDISEALAADLERAVQGRAPAWLPEDVAGAIRDQPGYADIVRQRP